LNPVPVDYSIWGALQQLVYQQQVQDVEHLKDVLMVTSLEQISRTLKNVWLNHANNLLAQPNNLVKFGAYQKFG